MANIRVVERLRAQLDEGWTERRYSDDNDNDPVAEFETVVNETFQELEELLLRKHQDYGTKNIMDAPGGAINGLRVRMHDKLARINNLHSNEPNFEPLEDSFKDMANYAIIGLLVLRGQWGK
jgi:hypothetical protein